MNFPARTTLPTGKLLSLVKEGHWEATAIHVNSTRTEQMLRFVYRGVLLGTAVGDALGLPAENLSPESIQRRWKGQWRMRLAIASRARRPGDHRRLQFAQGRVQPFQVGRARVEGGPPTTANRLGAIRLMKSTDEMTAYLPSAQPVGLQQNCSKNGGTNESGW